MENNNLSEKNYPRIAVCGVEGNITKALNATMEKMRANDEFGFDRIKFIDIETFNHLLVYSKADIKIYLDNHYLCAGFPFSDFLTEEQIQEAKRALCQFDYVLILCELYEWGGCTALDTAKFALEVGCKPFIIGAYPLKLFTMLDKYADKVLKGVRSIIFPIMW